MVHILAGLRSRGQPLAGRGRHTINLAGTKALAGVTEPRRIAGGGTVGLYTVLRKWSLAERFPIIDEAGVARFEVRGNMVRG